MTSTPRVCQCIHAAFHSVSNIAGLRFIPNFVADVARKKLSEQSTALHKTINSLEENLRPRTYLSRQHNLKSEEAYKLVCLEDIDGRKLNAQHFKQYGEIGHQLTYFIRNENIPDFIRSELIEPIENLPEVQALKTGKGRFDWNFTFNTYTQSNQTNYIAGFPFHVDIESNGDISAILTLLSSSELQMKKDTFVKSFEMTPGSLLLLSGESRWEWEHRVVPMKIESRHLMGSVERISLVLGCRFKTQQTSIAK